VFVCLYARMLECSFACIFLLWCIDLLVKLFVYLVYVVFVSYFDVILLGCLVV